MLAFNFNHYCLLLISISFCVISINLCVISIGLYVIGIGLCVISIGLCEIGIGLCLISISLYGMNWHDIRELLKFILKFTKIQKAGQC